MAQAVFHFNPALAGYAASDGALSGWRQTTALCRRRWHRKSPWRLFRPARPRAASLLQAERLSPDAAQLRDFHRQRRYPVCIGRTSPPAYADGETAARKTASPFMKRDVRPPERYLMERFITSPVWVDGEMRNGVIRNARLKPHRLSTAAVVSPISKTTRHGELYCIGLKAAGQRTVYMLGPANGDDQLDPLELCMSPYARSCWKNSARPACRT